MIDEYNLIYSNKENPNSKESTIKALIIDEAQDSNVPQMVAIGKMAKNVKIPPNRENNGYRKRGGVWVKSEWAAQKRGGIW